MTSGDHKAALMKAAADMSLLALAADQESIAKRLEQLDYEQLALLSSAMSHLSHQVDDAFWRRGQKI